MWQYHQITQNHSFWGPETIFYKISPLKKKSNQLILHIVLPLGQKYVQEIHPQHPLNKYFPTFTYSVNIFTKLTECIHHQVKDIWLWLYYHEYVLYPKVKELNYGGGSQKKLDTINFVHDSYINKVNFDVTYDKPLKILQIFIKCSFTNFDDFHVWYQNWHHYVWTSLCHVFFVNLLPNPVVWLFGIWHLFDILTHDKLLKPPQSVTRLFFQKKTGEIMEFCQSGKVGALNW